VSPGCYGPPAPEKVTMIDKKVTFAVATDATNVCHRRFGHLGTKAVLAMSKKELVWKFQSLKRINTKVVLALAVL